MLCVTLLVHVVLIALSCSVGHQFKLKCVQQSVTICRKKLPKVPETLLKKRKQRAEAKTRALKAAESNKKVCLVYIFVIHISDFVVCSRHWQLFVLTNCRVLICFANDNYVDTVLINKCFDQSALHALMQ